MVEWSKELRRFSSSSYSLGCRSVHLYVGVSCSFILTGGSIIRGLAVMDGWYQNGAGLLDNVSLLAV